MNGHTPRKRDPLLRQAAIVWLGAAAAFHSGCAAPTRSPRTARAPEKPAWSYEVRVDPDWHLNVVADFAPFGGALTISTGAEPFVDGVRVAVDGRERPASRTGAGWKVECAHGCRVRYRFRLAEAARRSSDVELAIAAGGAYFAPPSTWLLHPDGAPGQGRYRFRVEAPAGVRFVTGIRPAASSAAAAFEAPIASFEESSFAGFGNLAVTVLPESGITAAFAPETKPDVALLVDWVRRETAAVDAYLCRAGDGHAVVFVVPGTADGTRGETLGGGGASVFVRLGSGVTQGNLYDDWVLPHEMIHARFPSVRRTHAWFSEGLASYVEPFARVRAGLLGEAKLWAELVAGMPQGLPGPGDRGLDGNHGWGRVYWGGALYFLQADVELRQRTGGRHSLETALRAVVATGANVETVLPLARLLEVGDAATGTTVLRELYERMALAPGAVDLDALWKRLGVIPEAGTVRFDDGAPDARIRKSMTAPYVGAHCPAGAWAGPQKSEK